MKEFETYTEVRPKVEPLPIGWRHQREKRSEAEQSIADVAEWYIQHDPATATARGGLRKVLARTTEDLNIKPEEVVDSLHLVAEMVYDLEYQKVTFTHLTPEELEAVGEITYESVARDIIEKNGMHEEDGSAIHVIVSFEVGRLSLAQLSVLLGVALSGNIERIVRQVKETVLSHVYTILKEDKYHTW